MLLALLIAIGAGWLIYLANRPRPDEQALRTARARDRAGELYAAATALRAEREFPNAKDFATSVWRDLEEKFDDNFPALAVSGGAIIVARTLYEQEGFDPAAPPPDGTELDFARYSDQISRVIAKLSSPDTLAVARDAITQSVEKFSKRLPPLAIMPLVKLFAAESQFSVSLLETLPNVPEAVQVMVAPFFAERVISLGLFSELRNQFERNVHEMSGVPYRPIVVGSQAANSAKLVVPREHKGTSREVVNGYLTHTPLESLFAADIPFDIPEQTRFEHHWIVAGSGHGKTQTLQHLIAHDLERVKEGKASVAVIDSQGDLIRNVADLGLFGAGEPLDGKLCLIDPTDIEYPVALNLFDVGMERINRYSPLDRERLMNGVLELYDFVLGSLLSAELTQKQSVIFRYITRLMLHIPGATIHTLRELMEPKGYEKYLPYIAKLEGTARAFFETEFNSKQFEDTKRQVVRRLWGILENQTFERMFSHPKNKLDLFTEMNSGKVILINTAKELLKQNGTEIFGRFFIALIAQVAQERATLSPDDRMPTFVYIDECADYLDRNVSLILEQARKFNVGMVLAHQYIGQLSPKLQESFSANTSIKFAGGVSEKDAKTLAHMLRSTPEFIDRQPKGHFAASVRNLTSSAVSLRIPFGYLENMPRMSDREKSMLRDRMRERYAAYWKEIGLSEPVAEVAVDPDTIDIAPATEW